MPTPRTVSDQRSLRWGDLNPRPLGYEPRILRRTASLSCVDHIGLEPIRQPACKASPLSLSITHDLALCSYKEPPGFSVGGLIHEGTPTRLRNQAPGRSAAHTSSSWSYRIILSKGPKASSGLPSCVGGFPGPPNPSVSAPPPGFEPRTHG